MNTKPILMSGAMVRATLEGRKTMTRRVIKPRRDGGVITGPAAQPGGAIEAWGGGARHIPSQMEVQSCPYGQPGDLLWVREAWRTGAINDPDPPRDLLLRTSPVYHLADGEPPPAAGAGRYRHARFMPRWASRITLRIIDVRVERVQEISEEDAKAEGAKLMAPHFDGFVSESKWTSHKKGFSYRNGFQYLWESINGPGSWQANSWVWVVAFEPILENVDSVLAREVA